MTEHLLSARILTEPFPNSQPGRRPPKDLQTDRGADRERTRRADRLSHVPAGQRSRRRYYAVRHSGGTAAVADVSANDSARCGRERPAGRVSGVFALDSEQWQCGESVDSGRFEYVMVGGVDDEAVICKVFD